MLDWTPFAYRGQVVNGITSCQVCGFPTTVDFGYTCCQGCKKLVCATCEDEHCRPCYAQANVLGR